MGDGRVSAGDLPAVMQSGVEKAIGIQHSAVAGYVQRLRRARPDATPADVIAALERQYLAAVTGAGAAVGGAAAVPGAGTGLALALSAGETAVFLETTALFTLAVAEVHAIRVDEVERRRTLVLTVVLGDGGTMLVEKVTGRTGEHWGRLLTELVPMSSISAVNKALCHWFVNQYPRNRGVVVVGRILPFGIGAGIGAVGNHAFGRMVVNASRRAFGPPPASFSGEAFTIVDTLRETVEPVVPRPRAETALADEKPLAGEKPPADQKPPAEQVDPPATGKYRPLFEYLLSQSTDRIELGFSDIDALVPGGLPKSASTVRTWWGNSSSSRQAKAWLAAGFEAVEVDLDSKTVRFERRGRS